MAPKTRLTALIVTLIITIVGAVYYAPAPALPPVRAGQTEGAATAPAQAQAAGAESPPFLDLRLEALELERPAPTPAGRNPFRVQAARPAPPAAAPDRAPRLPTATPAAFGGPPGATTTQGAIPLKFIGLVNRPERQERIAVLSDGTFVYHGREGETIDGRYRIVKIGEESIEMERVSGGGRQVIRLTGS